MARPGLLRNRKFGRLAGALEPFCECGGDIAAMGALELLWAAGYEAADDYIGDDLDVERAAHWRGPRGELVQALLKAGGDGPGFIESCEDRPKHYRIHDFWVHAPDYVRRRRERENERESKGISLAEARSRAGKAGAAAKAAAKAAKQSSEVGSNRPATDPSGAYRPQANGKQKYSLPDQDQDQDQDHDRESFVRSGSQEPNVDDHPEVPLQPAPAGAGPGGSGNGKSLRVDDLLHILERESCGGFVYSAANKGQSVTIQKFLGRKDVDREVCERMGAYLKAVHAGRGGEPLGTPALSAKLADLANKSRLWDEAGRPSLEYKGAVRRQDVTKDPRVGKGANFTRYREGE